MALHLLLSTSTDRLIDDLVASLSLPGHAHTQRPVLLPSRPLVERVRVALARRTGVAMGVQFLLPAAFVDRLGQALGQEPLHASWTPEGMFWRLYGLLEENKDQPRLAAACADESARISLAHQVADRFDQYLHFRPQLIAAWDQGEAWGPLPDSAREDERWQRLLWNGLKSQLKEFPHPAQRLERLLEKARTAAPGLLAPAVEVLATGPLPAAQLRVLAALGTNAEVRLRVLMPSSAYFGDIQSAKAQRYLDLDADADTEGHPLLAQMGTQARAHLRTLIDLDESGQALEDIEPHWEEPRSLLGRLQADIRASQQVSDRADLDLSAERSLRVHRCHGPRREVEVLRDEILRAFDELPALKAEEILILAPDLQVYGPLAESILAGTGLPLRLAERKSMQIDPMQQVARALLAMAAGRCTLSEGLDLLELPAVRQVLGQEISEALAQRLSVAGITFGLDREHRQQLAAGTENTGTWRAGLDRLLAGLWLGHENGSLDSFAEPALPVAGDLGTSNGVVDGLAWIESLLGLLQTWQEPATPEVWAQRIDTALESLFLGRGFDQVLDLTGIDETLSNLRQASLEHGAVLELQAASILAWMDEYASDDARLVSPVGGAMALGGLKPLRALPCRVLAILGLKDSAFPRRSQAPAWDLMAAKKQAGDRDPREEDRQLFLDAILAAKDRVILCAPAVSPQTNKEEPLSACVDELLREAERTAARDGVGQAQAHEALVQKHSLQPFSEENFKPEAHSYDRFNAALGLALAPSQIRHLAPFDTGVVPPGAGSLLLSTDLDTLLRFLRDPARAWLHNFKISPAGDAEDIRDDDAEPLNLDGLQKWQLVDTILRSVLKGEEPHLSHRLAADRLLPYGRLGQASSRIVSDQVHRLVQNLQTKVLAPWRPQGLNAQWGAYHLSGTVLQAADGKSLVFCSASKLDKPMVRLEAWLRACLSARAGQPKVLWVGAFDKDDGAQLKELAPISPERAQASLNQILNLWQVSQKYQVTFSPKTSLAVAEVLRSENGNDTPQESADLKASLKARSLWEDKFFSSGEGEKPSNRLAWRGQKPLEGANFQRWKKTALDVWAPVLDWWA